MNTEFRTQTIDRLGLGLVSLAAILWGTTGVFVRALYSMTATNALSVGFFRLALALPLLWIASWLVLRRRFFQIKGSDFGVMLLIGGLIALYQVCYFGAIGKIGVAASTLLTLCTAPVWVALLAAICLRERLTRTVLLAGSCAIGGTLLLVGKVDSLPAESLIGVILALVSALGYATLVLCSRRLAEHYHPLQSLTISFTVGAMLLWLCTLPLGWVVNYSIGGWGILLYLGIVPTAIAYALYFHGMRSTSATAASITTLLEPLVSTLLAGWIFGERLGSLGLVGAALLAGAIGLLYWGDRR